MKKVLIIIVSVFAVLVGWITSSLSRVVAIYLIGAIDVTLRDTAFNPLILALVGYVSTLIGGYVASRLSIIRKDLSCIVLCVLIAMNAVWTAVLNYTDNDLNVYALLIGTTLGSFVYARGYIRFRRDHPRIYAIGRVYVPHDSF